MKRLSLSLGLIVLLWLSSGAVSLRDYGLPFVVGNKIVYTATPISGSTAVAENLSREWSVIKTVQGERFFGWLTTEQPEGTYDTTRWSVWERFDADSNLWVIGPDTTQPAFMYVPGSLDYAVGTVRRSSMGGPKVTIDSVESLTDSVTVPAGTFRNLMRLRKTTVDTTTDEVVKLEIHYYAKGIGDVYEVDSLPLSQALEYQLVSVDTISVADNIVNLTFAQEPMTQGGSFDFSFQTGFDSAMIAVYIDTNGNGIVDTGSDLYVGALGLLDNVYGFGPAGDHYNFPDADSTNNALRWVYGPINWAPAQYLFQVKAGDKSAVAPLLMLPTQKPYRTVTGTVTVPAGFSSAWHTVQIQSHDGQDGIQALTDASGDFRLVLDSATVAEAGGVFDVTLQSENTALFREYGVSPISVRVDVAGDSVTDVYFTFTPLNSGVKGVVTAGGVPVKNAGLSLKSKISGAGTLTFYTDSLGQFLISCSPDTYQVSFDYSRLDKPYMEGIFNPSFRVENADTFVLDTIKFFLCDTVVKGRVMKEGGKPDGHYAIYVSSKNGHGNQSVTTDDNGYFRVPVTSLDTAYSVGVRVDWGSQNSDSLPVGYVFENGDMWQGPVKPGDSVVFNMIPLITAGEPADSEVVVSGLGDPQPNPFNPSVVIPYALSSRGSVRMTVYDVSGRMVAQLVNAVRQAGRYSVSWNGTGLNGAKVSSGVYLCRMQAGTLMAEKRLMFLK